MITPGSVCPDFYSCSRQGLDSNDLETIIAGAYKATTSWPRCLRNYLANTATAQDRILTIVRPRLQSQMGIRLFQTFSNNRLA